MGKYDETVCHCALGKAFGYEPKIALAIIENLGSASALYELSGDELTELLGPYSRYRPEICERRLEEAASELNRLMAEGVRFLPLCDRAYPLLLKDCEDPPLGLYYKGVSSPEEIFRHEPMISVVGTRDISLYGEEWCRKIVSCLTLCRAGIVSGLALGTDITAHLTALDRGLPTIAVMATGIDSVYPYRHRAHAERIASTPGCALVTDYPPGTVPLQMNFLRRNRIIAGLSMATILIESKIRGGGIMTAGLAFSYGREVYALPGRADDLRSLGCNKLILDNIAEPILDITTLGRSLGLKLGHAPGRESPEDLVRRVYGSGIPERTAAAAAALLRCAGQRRGMTIEEISASCHVAYTEMSAVAAMLEADGIIRTDLLQRCTINPK